MKLPGLEIKGHLEPSHALVDLMVQMLEQGVLTPQEFDAEKARILAQ